MKIIILLITLNFLYIGVSAQQDSNTSIKTEFVTMENHSKPSVLQSKAEILVDVNNRGSQNAKITAQYLTIQRNTSPIDNIKPTAQLAMDETLKIVNKDTNHYQYIELTFEPKSKPSEINATAIKVE